jgi:hypothetical protein
MPRRFITEVDIEELFRQGERTLSVTPDMTLTDLAYERARQRGIKLIDGQIPSAPVRPYLVNRPGAAGAQKTEPAQGKDVQPVAGVKMPLDLSASGLKRDELHERIRAAVARQLGGQIDAKVVETIIRRILDSTGVR